MNQETAAITPHPLKAEVDRLGIKVTVLSLNAGIVYPRLARILDGRTAPTEDEVSRIRAALGPQLDAPPEGAPDA